MAPKAALVSPLGSTSIWMLDDAAWQPVATTPGLWPIGRPGAGEWTASVIDASARLDHLDAAGTSEVPGSRTEPPMLMAPRVAHYALWAPDGRALCYVVPDGRALSLRTWRPPETAARVHLSAAPVFPAWVPGTDWLVCHHGTTLSAFETVTGEQRVLSNSASGFRTPAIAPDGTVAWAEVGSSGVSLHTGHLERPIPSRRLANFPGGVAISVRPGAADLAVAVARQPESGVFSEVLLLRDDRPPRRIVSGPLVAYWWSPAGDQLATLHPSYTGDGRFQVRFVSPEGVPLGAAEPLIPSIDTATAVTFFDQYALSHPAWSADGRWFGLSGRLVREGPHPSFHGSPADRALVWDTKAGFAPTEIADAVFLSFARVR